MRRNQMNKINALNSIYPSSLKTESTEDPIGVDTPSPCFQWKLVSPRPDMYQSAYRIMVADEQNDTVWDSGKIFSDRQIQIPYSGKPLKSASRYTWRVMVWDHTGESSPWSEKASFETGLLNVSDWIGKWIGGSEDFLPLQGLHWITAPVTPGETVDFCLNFTITDQFQQAVFDGTAFDSWELICNGIPYRKMNREWKQDGTSPIRCADLTEYLIPGKNELCFRVTSDPTCRISAIGRLDIFSKDGCCSYETGQGWIVRKESGESNAQVMATYGDEPWGYPRRRGAAPLLRKEFILPKDIGRARLYISALGYGDCTINGMPVTDALLCSEYSQYDKTIYYNSWDVTDLLHPGKNCLGVELGRGYYGYFKDWIGIMKEQDDPKLLLQLMVFSSKGKVLTIVSDDSWKTIYGPTRDDSVWYGEKYDSRLLPDGWNLPGYQDSGWNPVRIMKSPGGVMRSAISPPIRITEELTPVSISSPAANLFVYDFGKVTAGRAQIHVNEASGTRIRITYGERLLENGRIDIERNCGQFWEPAQTDIYICRGGDEVWAPKFSYKGYRYIEVHGSSHIIDIKGQVFHNDLKTTGHFQCSNNLFNKIHGLVTPTILNNFHSIPTDTPTYEKRGWTGDAQSICSTALLNLGADMFFRKYVQDLLDSQNSIGAIPDTCPGPLYYPPAPEWMCAMVMIPFRLYLQCGDEFILKKCYPAMVRYTDYETNRLQDGLSSNLHYGDWNSPAGSCPPEGSVFNSTCYVYQILKLMEKAATILNNQSDALRFAEKANEIRNILNQRFFDKETLLYHTEILCGFRQTPTVLALAFGIIPDGEAKSSARALAENIREKDRCHLSTGCMGLKFLAPVLTRLDQAETAFKIVNQTDCPSWGYWLKKGATTCWETWDTDTRSLNHFYFGTIDDWFYECLAGITPTAPGYRQFRVQPYPCGDLTEVSADLETPYGIIAVWWHLEGTVFTIQVTVPVNTSAEVILPGGKKYQTGSGSHRYTETLSK